MKNKNKYFFLYFSFITLLFFTIYGTATLRDKNIEFQKEILVKQAQTHFKDQINNRKWNAQFGGVFVKEIEGLKPNSYLKKNTIKTEDGEILVKINPAWMTRQLSDLSNIENFQFKITSLNPINPANKPDKFEAKALKMILDHNLTEYYEIENNNKFRYVGALVTTKSCLECHAYENYKIGDIRGGISIDLDASNYESVIHYIDDKVLKLRLFIIFLLLSITLLLHKQFKNNENLKSKIEDATKEILSTKYLLQEVLDADHSFLMVFDGLDTILANKTILRFFDCDSLDAFKKEYTSISNAFVKVENKNFLTEYVNGEHWLSYLQKEQESKVLKVLMKKDAEDRYFKPHIKKVVIENKTFLIVIFDEITEELHKIKILKDKASRDALTKLFNKGKFFDVLSHEILLSEATGSPLSMIFLDIDHFKIVNDTYGHDSGDYVLKELAKILHKSTRKGDFIARWGGEEFVVTLQATDLKEAEVIAEKVRVNVEKHTFLEGGNQKISLGVTQFIACETLESFTKRVDDALYKAKKSGRNRVVTL